GPRLSLRPADRGGARRAAGSRLPPCWRRRRRRRRRPPARLSAPTARKARAARPRPAKAISTTTIWRTRSRTIGIEFIETLAGPGKGRSRPRTDNSTAVGGLTSAADVRPESQTSIKTEDSPNQQELEGLASGAESIVVRPGNQTSTKTEDTPNQKELERRREIVRQFFNDFWRSADAKPVTFAERLNLAEGYINERLVACGEAWQLDSAVRKQLGLPPHSHHPIRRK